MAYQGNFPYQGRPATRDHNYYPVSSEIAAFPPPRRSVEIDHGAKRNKKNTKHTHSNHASASGLNREYESQAYRPTAEAPGLYHSR